MQFWHRYQFWLISAVLHAALIGSLLWQFAQPQQPLSVAPYRPVVQAYVVNTLTPQHTAMIHHQLAPNTAAQQPAQPSPMHASTVPSSHQPSINDAQLKRILLAVSQLIAQHLPTQTMHADKLVKIGFTLTPSGTIEQAHIIQTSGSSDLDTALLHCIQTLPAQRLASLSQQLTQSINVVAPIQINQTPLSANKFSM